MSQILKKLIGEAEAIKSVAEQQGAWSPELAKQFEAKLGEIDRAKAMSDLGNRFDETKAWAAQSSGSAVLDSYRSAGPNEGVIPGLTEDGGELTVNEAADVPDDMKMLGAKMLKHLKSGEYKTAYADYIRAEGLKRSVKSDSMKVLQEGSDSAGGFWVPPDTRNQVIAKMATVPGVMNDVYKFTTGSDLVTFPKVVYTTDDLYTTGIMPAWTAEAPAADISESTNPVAGRAQIPVHTLTAAILVTRAMLEDAQFDILGYISAKLGENIPLFINNALINGDGVGKPLGIKNHPLAATAYSSGGMQVLSGVSGAVSWQGASGSEDPTKGLLGLEAALPPQYENNAKFYAAKTTFAAVRGLVDSSKRPLWQQSDGAFQSWVRGYPGTLLGYPIVKDQFMPAIATTTRPVMFGDLTGYYMPQRVGLSIEVLRELKALRDMVVVYARMRLGGELVEDYKVKLLKTYTS